MSNTITYGTVWVGSGVWAYNPPNHECSICKKTLPSYTFTEIIVDKKTLIMCNECLKEIIGKDKLDRIVVATEL